MTLRFGKRRNSREMGTGQGQENLAEVRLGRHGLWRLRGGRRAAPVTCLEGTVWITQEGDPRDHVLMAGEDFRPTRRGRVLVEAVRDARLQVALLR